MSETVESFVAAFDESADAPPLSEWEKKFDAVLIPLREKLDASMANTRGVENLPKRVTAAETLADELAGAAESAAIGQKWDVAFALLDQSKAAMSKLDEAYTSVADVFDRWMARRIDGLALRQEGLKGTGLTGAADDAQARLAAVIQARAAANAGATTELRLVGLRRALDDARSADSDARAKLTAEANAGAARGLVEIRKSMAAAISALTHSVPVGDPTPKSKRELEAELQAWDDDKTAADRVTDADEMKSKLEALYAQAREILSAANYTMPLQTEDSALGGGGADRDVLAARLKLAQAKIGTVPDEHGKKPEWIGELQEIVEESSLLDAAQPSPESTKKIEDLNRQIDTLIKAVVEQDGTEIDMADSDEHCALLIERLRVMSKSCLADIQALPECAAKNHVLSEHRPLDEKRKQLPDIADLGQRIAQAEDLIYSFSALVLSGAQTAAKIREQETFANALKSRFGIEIQVPDGMSNTHFENFYEMMARVPVQHSSQDMLQKLIYYATEDWKEKAAYGDAEIEMGSFEMSSSLMKYTDPETGEVINDPISGMKAYVNGFNISALHEIGHAVDEKYKIMADSMTKSSCGAWKKEAEADIAAALLAELKGSSSGLALGDDIVKAALLSALTDGSASKPGAVTDDDWAKIEPQLTKVASIRAEKSPWETEPPVLIDNRACHQSYDRDGAWVSYDPAARSSMVRNYQFRAPGEWFADLYAWSWYAKKPPPGAVDKDVAKYMYSKNA